MENRTIIKTSKLSKTFSHEGVQQHVLKNVDLEIKEHEFTVIMGSSGAGKSTLLYALSGMDKPSLGQVEVDGENIVKMNENELAIFRRKHCGFVFQQIYLLDNMSVMDNVIVSGLLTSKDRKEIAKKARNLFSKIKISSVTWHKFPAQISGGEAQRAGIVRALINEPVVLFADEPTGALDQESGTAVLDILTDVAKEGQTVVMVTHDLKSARRADRIIYLKDGNICGELRLSQYTGENDKKRNETLIGFLEEMGW
ncbi:MAG: ABC transporter ATP-binding protein [Lachnospiraceae bacterium]|jgi:putative ABC transport system ATP-binding protein|nr:ABC transporter ATP-binding protein [Lachnospiraceae bacterium]